MVKDSDWEFFNEHGFVLIKGVLDPDRLGTIQMAYEEIWEQEESPVNQQKLLQRRPFIDLIQHRPIIDQHIAVFGSQTQLLQYDLLRQEPHSERPERAWHRDFSFPGEYPLSINTIVYLDSMTDERGPTYVVPGSHLGWRQAPSGEDRCRPIPGEIAIHAEPGDAAFINSAVWHSATANRSDGWRRTVYLYYGHWWLKRYEWQHAVPWQALEGADEERLVLLGVKQPEDLHMYRVDAKRNQGHIR
ncbi:MAG: hypothetical protein HOH43_28050 [Candidatus Latescibacteria bacterium]|jgi:ectoine hydroxylase-related dioxygenase (phytanoyl-CoA dioxygenase family)|nr:hypothetical protein [Candidatus Latescibacterota bacterium]